MLLDEPTNYLDLDAIEWLENFLSTFKGAVLLISHDRFFLDQVVTGIYEIEAGRLKRYRGNYSAYRITKEADHEAATKAYLIQSKEISQTGKVYPGGAALLKKVNVKPTVLKNG